VILTLGFYVVMLAQQQTVKTLPVKPFNREGALAKLRKANQRQRKRTVGKGFQKYSDFKRRSRRKFVEGTSVTDARSVAIAHNCHRASVGKAKISQPSK